MSILTISCSGKVGLRYSHHGIGYKTITLYATDDFTHISIYNLATEAVAIDLDATFMIPSMNRDLICTVSNIRSDAHTTRVVLKNAVMLTVVSLSYDIDGIGRGCAAEEG